MFAKTSTVSSVLALGLALTGCSADPSGKAGEEGKSNSAAPGEPGRAQITIDGGKPEPVVKCENITLDVAANVFNVYTPGSIMVQVETNADTGKVTRVAYGEDSDPELTTATTASGATKNGEVAGSATFTGDGSVEFRFDDGDCVAEPGDPGEPASGSLPPGLTAPEDLAVNTIQFAGRAAEAITCSAGEKADGGTELILNIAKQAALGVTFDFEGEQVSAVRVMEGDSDIEASRVSGSGAKGLVTGWADYRGDENSAVAFAFDNTACGS